LLEVFSIFFVMTDRQTNRITDCYADKTAILYTHGLVVRATPYI